MLWEPIDLNATCPAQTNLSACSDFGFMYLNLLVHLFGDSQDRRIQEKLGITDDQEMGNEEYDFIVVGAGAAGCVVANRLSAEQKCGEKWKVLLLEAGSEQPDVTLVPGLAPSLKGTNLDWGYSTEPNGKSCLAKPGQRCGFARGKTMGGSTSINSMTYIRGNRVDYDLWAALGNKGWSYKDVLPYFKKTENNQNIDVLDPKYHGVGGEQAVSYYTYVDATSIMMRDALNETGLPLTDFNGRNQHGTMQAQTFTLKGQRVSTNNALIQPIRYTRNNLVVRINSEVVKVLIDHKKRAYGVQYVRNGTLHTATAKKEVIVSGGVINSPKLLMLSGIGPEKHLRDLNIPVVKNLAVGRNLLDHPTFNGIVIALSDEASTVVADDVVVNETRKYKAAARKRGPLSADGPVTTLAFVKTEPGLVAPDVQINIDNVMWREYIKEPLGFDSVPIFPTAFYDGLVPRLANLIPESRGYVELNKTNPNGPPLIHTNYLDVPSDVTRIKRAVKMFLKINETEAFKASGARFVEYPLEACKDYTWGSDEYIVCLIRSYTSTTYHPVGTCKMGPAADRWAVVDSSLRVRGVLRLRVVDAAVMPTVPHGNTNAPTMMVAEKGAADIIDYWANKIENCSCD